MTDTTTILLVAHGSRNGAGNRETLLFAEQWRARHADWRIEVCFIEHADVLLDDGLDVAARDTGRVIAVPLILNAAGHVKMELPAALARARQRHPGVQFRVTRHLGMGREIFVVLQRQLDQLLRELHVPDPLTTSVVVLGRGSSDAAANGELAKMARWLFEANEHPLVDLAFTGIAWPRLETVVQRQVKLGAMQVCVLPVYLFTGVLIERIQLQITRLRQQYPHVAFALGSHFGFDPGIFALLDQRVGGDGQQCAILECDGCKYRELAEDEHLHDHSHTVLAAPAAKHAHDERPVPVTLHQHGHGSSHQQHTT